MKRKGLVKKAVLPALVALVCSVIALTSVSYAWFTMGDKASVSGMEMKVEAAGGLQVSAVGSEGTFKSNLGIADLYSTYTEDKKVPLTGNQFPDEVSPVSTNGKLSEAKQLVFYTGEIVNGQLAQIAQTTANYIVFDIYVKVNVDNTLYLEKSSTVTCAGKDTELASRVAFVNLGYAQTAANAMAGTLTGDPTVKIWEPNSTERSQAYKDATADSAATKKAYEGIKDSTGSSEAVTTHDFNDNDLELCALKAGYNRIRVYIWLEGQDVDCLNEVSGGTLQIALNLRQNKVE